MVVGAVEDVENRVFPLFATVAPMWDGLWMKNRSGQCLVDNSVIVHKQHRRCPRKTRRFSTVGAHIEDVMDETEAPKVF